MKKDSSNDHWLDASDLLNQLLVIVVGIVVLFVNLGIMDSAILAFWPLVLIIIGLRGLMHNHR